MPENTKGKIQDSGPTLARLSFRVPPERISEFEVLYEEKAAPILKRIGLAELSEKDRSSKEGIFSRLFEMKRPIEVAKKRETLQGDSAWGSLMWDFGIAFGDAGPDGLIHYILELYKTPAGPGRTVSRGQETGFWRTYDATDGLGSGFVMSMLQDREGNLWFAAFGGGVSRYDGQTFTTFTTNDGLAHNEVSDLLQDQDGNMWFATEGGVSRFDGQSFKNFTTDDGLAHNEVSTLLQDRDGILWFGTEGGLSRLDSTFNTSVDQPFTTLTQEDGLASNNVEVVFQDLEGHFWIGTQEGLSRYNGRIFSTFTTKEGLGDNWVRSIVRNRAGFLWFGTNNGGVSRFNGQEFTTYSVKDGMAGNGVMSAFEDRDGILWFGTSDGVTRYDPLFEKKGDGKDQKGSFANFTEQDGLANNWVFSIIQDREGHLWFGTFSGVSRYDEKTFTTTLKKDGLSEKSVFSILQDQEGKVWSGTGGGGIIRYGPKGHLTTYASEDGLPNDVILSVFQDRDKKLWFSTGGNGVCCYDGKTFVTFTETDGLAHNRVWRIIQDRRGDIWFGTFDGVNRYDGHSFTTFTTTDGLVHNRVRSVIEDRRGRIWFGTFGGVSRYDPPTSSGQGSTPRALGSGSGGRFTNFTVNDGLPSDSVWSMLEDREGNLWFGTSGGGVCRYDGHTFATLTRNDGLASDHIWSILEDREGNLWFGTSGGGLSRYDGRVFQTFTAQDGLVGNVVHAILQDQEGIFWLCTNNGITRYRPPEPCPPPVFIDAIVAGRRREGITELEVSDSTGLVAFEFHGMSYKTRPEAMVYRYRLEGLDGAWKNTHERRVEYQDLPVGTYRFEVVGVDRDLAYSHTPGRVDLKVVRDNRDKQIDELERRVQERTRELQEKHAQLAQSEKMASLGNLVAGISHEINNPIGAFNSSADVSRRCIERIAHLLEAGEIEVQGSPQFQKVLKLLEENNRTIISAGDRIAQIVRSLRNFARLDEAEFQEVDLHEGLENTLTLLQHEFRDRISLVKDYGDIPPVRCYPGELNQVFMNLLVNAIQAVEGRGTIRIETFSDPSYVYVRISDSGKGISGENLPKIFDPGFTTTGVGVGTGLGLSISYNIVKKHIGEIDVESQVGEGSTFTVRIPVGLDG